jgi:hypothetical protein
MPDDRVPGRPDPERLDLDRLIDAALGTYGAADSGLEGRVLALVVVDNTPARRTRRVLSRWMMATVALAAAACLLLFILLERSRPAHMPDLKADKTSQLQPVSKAAPHVAPRLAQRTSRPPRNLRLERIAGNSVATALLPRQDVFPTPRPLSSQERALADFATRAPQAERNSFVEAQKQMEAPIDIAGIHIDALEIPPLEPPRQNLNRGTNSGTN